MDKPIPLEQQNPECYNVFKKIVDGETPFVYDRGVFINKRTHIRMSPKVGRNDQCPCGSGKKYKKCCLTI